MAKRRNEMILWSYIKSLRFLSLLIRYLILSVLLNVFFKTDIMIPCIYSKVTGTECLGCGMNRAAVEVCQLNIKKAWEYNSLFFVFVPLMLSFFTIDYLRFKKNKINEFYKG